MKFGFVTCVQLGLSCLEELRGLGSVPDLMITLHDEMATGKSGRIYLDDFSNATGAPLLKVRHINDAEAIGRIRSADLDWLFIIGWSQIAGPDVLSSPRLGSVGMHPTLLPEGRGRASIPWAIIKGLDKTGVSMFVLDEGVDTGPVIAQEVIDLSPNETATDLYVKVDRAHISLIRQTWPRFVDGSVAPKAQDDARATVWPGRRPEDGAIQSKHTTDEVDRLVRALASPYPGARFVDEFGHQWIIDPEGTGSSRPAFRIPTADGYYTSTSYRKLQQPPGVRP